MAYVLDAQLLPPGGAPVQCTQCLHVFIAHPPQEGAEEAGVGAVTPAGKAATAPFGVTPSRGRVSTQLFGAAELGPAAPRKGTGTPGGEMPPAEPGPQTFGAMRDAAASPPAPARTGTQAFGAVTSLPSTGRDETPPVEAPATTRRARTRLFGGGGEVQPSPGEALSASSRASDTPEVEPLLAAAKGPSHARPRLALPVEPESLTLHAAEEAPSERLASGKARAGEPRRVVLWMGGVLAAVAVGVGAWKALVPRPYEPAPAAQLARDNAARLLRRDDAASRERALAELEALATSEPQFLEARADLAVGLAFQLDDVRLALRTERALHAKLAEQVARLESTQVPSDWQNRVNALQEEMKEVRGRAAPLEAQAEALERRLDATVASLASVDGELPPSQTQAVVRAQAVAHGVRGSPQVVALTERYRQQGAMDGWGDVAYAEYVLNAPAGRAGLERARESLGALKDQDASFVRLFVLEARLALLARELEVARSNLESVLTLNPEHTLARKLLEHLEEDGLADED